MEGRFWPMESSAAVEDSTSLSNDWRKLGPSDRVEEGIVGLRFEPEISAGLSDG